MRAYLYILACLCLCLAACGDEDFGGNWDIKPPKPLPHARIIGAEGGVKAEPAGGVPVGLTVSGVVTFDRLPVTVSGLGTTPSVQPCANVLIEVVAHNDISNVLAAGATDAAGNYSVTFNSDLDYFVRARAESGTAPDVDRVFHPHTKPLITHAVTSQVQHRSAGNAVVDLHANYQIFEQGYLKGIRAAPFAILDTMQRMRASVAASFAGLGPIDAYWMAQNNDVSWYYQPMLKNAAGQVIYTSRTFAELEGPHGNPSLYVNGGYGHPLANADSDQYDESVIAYYWTSLLQRLHSRDNGFLHPGYWFPLGTGSDTTFNRAYSGGVRMALGSALLGQPVYRNTVGYPGGTPTVQFVFDCESGILPGAGTGYAAEYRVARVIWDLIDGGAGWPADADGDAVNIAQDDFFASFAALATRGAPYAVAWLPSLLQQLIDDGFLSQSDADTLMQAQGASFPPPGGGDPWPGAIALGAAGVSAVLDANLYEVVYKLDVPAAQSVTITFTGTTQTGKPEEHRLTHQLWDIQGNILIWKSILALGTHVETLNLGAGTYIFRVYHSGWPNALPTGFTLTAQ